MDLLGVCVDSTVHRMAKWSSVV